MAKAGYELVFRNMNTREIYNAAIEKEKAGHVSDAIKLYLQVIEESPGTQEAEMAISALDNIKEVFNIQIKQKYKKRPKEQKAAYYLFSFNLPFLLVCIVRQVLVYVQLLLFGYPETYIYRNYYLMEYTPDHWGTFSILSIILGLVLYQVLYPHIQAIRKVGDPEAILIIVVLFFVTPILPIYTFFLLSGLWSGHLWSDLLWSEHWF